MKLFYCASLVLLALIPCAFSRTFTKCEVARELYSVGHPMEDLPAWMCLVNGESAFNSSAIGGPNSNGSSDWGLFQINDNYWCTLEGAGNDCNVNCYDLVDDDITDDLACVKIIYARHGFSAWHAWTKRCQEDLSSWAVDECF